MKTFSIKPSGDERLETIPCVVCHNGETRPHWECDAFRFSRCTRCGHVFQNPQPVFEDLKLRYDQEYFRYEIDNAVPFLQLMKLGLDDLRFFDHEEGLRVRGGFLDVGCATAALPEAFRRRGWSVYGVEICEPAARYGIDVRGVPVHIGTLDDAPFVEGQFAAIHSSHVIEHVSDPRSFVRRIFELLQPDGRMVIVTPDRSGFQARLFGRRWRSAIADHVNLFSFRHLSQLLEQEGFEIERKCSWGGLAAGASPGWIKRPADRIAKWFNIGDVMAILARKP